MDTYRNPTSRLFVIVTILVLVIAVLLACGPADESVQTEIGNIAAAPQDSDPDTTPEPTCAETAGDYPKLDEVLTEVFTKYETCELDAEAAADLAYASHESKVLVEVHPTEGQLEALDRWMGKQKMDPRGLAEFYETDGYYAYVEVSKLGILSEQDIVSEVNQAIDPTPIGFHRETVNYEVGPDGVARRVPKSTELAIPAWLKGYKHPANFPKLKGSAKSLARQHVEGTLDMDMVRESDFRCVVWEDNLAVSIFIENDPAALQRLRESLDGIAVGDIYTDDKMVSYGQRQVHTLVPIPKLAGLNQIPEIIEVDGGACGETFDGSKAIPSETDLQDAIAQVVPKAGTGTVKTQGLASHNAASWQDATHKGAGVKIGIIDTGFEDARFGTELPRQSQVGFYCYPGLGSLVTSNSYSDCNHSDKHGSQVAEIVADMAPQAQLYFGNAGYTTDDFARRLYDTTVWMVGQGVQIISVSVGSLFEEGMADGVQRNYPYDIYLAIDYAERNGVIWVNAAGNHRDSLWYGRYVVGRTFSTYTVHDFEPGELNDYLYILNEDGNHTWFGNIHVELRWDDSWLYADCDLDLRLQQEYGGGLFDVGGDIDTQNGEFTDRPNASFNDPISVTSGKLVARVFNYGCTDLDWLQLVVRKKGSIHVKPETRTIDGLGAAVDNTHIAVGAVHRRTTNTIAYYSGNGPTTDGRPKPDIVGVACVDTAAKTETTIRAGCFSGTSAATPHIAGLLAMIKSRHPHFSPKQLMKFLYGNVLKRDGSWTGYDFGNGFPYLHLNSQRIRLPTYVTDLYVGQPVRHQLLADGIVSTQTVEVETYTSDGPGDLYLSSGCSSRTSFKYLGTRETFSLIGCGPGQSELTLKRYGSDERHIYQMYNINVRPAVTGVQCDLETRPPIDSLNFGLNWDSRCISFNHMNSYARYLSFQVRSETEFTFDVTRCSRQ